MFAISNILDHDAYFTRKTHVLHHANSLLSLGHKLILGLLNFLLRLRADLLFVCGIPRALLCRSNRRHRQLPNAALGLGLRSVEGQSRLFDTLACPGSKHNVRVQGGVPSSQETALNLRILRQPGLANALLCQSKLLKCVG